MTNAFTGKPAADEYPEFYASYIALVPGGDVRTHLQTQMHLTIALFSNLSETQGLYAYAPAKWTLKQVLGHMTDAERVFSYRILCIARDDKTSLPPFDENEWVPKGGANERTIPSLVNEYAAVRNASLQLVNGLTEEAIRRKGTANNRPITARAIAFILAGHERHHWNVVRERYLKS